MFSYMFAPILILTGILFLWWYSTHMKRKRLPQGPMPLPIIGNLHLLGKHPHRALHKLSQKYGTTMSIRLGSINTVILSSPDAAKLFIGNHDAQFSSRPNMQLSKYLYNVNKGILLSDYGEYWRNIRKFVTVELIGPTKLIRYTGMRREEMGLMIEEIRIASKTQQVVNLSDTVGRLIESMMCRMLFGKKYDVLSTLVNEFAEMAGTFNLADYVPMLAPFDLQGLVPRFKSFNKYIDETMEKMINEHEEHNSTVLQTGDQTSFIDILLSLKDKQSSIHENLSNTIDRESMKAILLDMVAGGIDTSKTSIEWVLSTLLKYPRVMKKVQNELKTTIGDKQMVDETDLKKLTYLHMVIKETFRLYPIVPLLIPHVSKEDITINGYDIPKQSQVILNVWAFGRDPEVWCENWAEFLPERFLDRDIDFRTPDFQLLQFGIGRRGCPAMNLGLLNIGFVVSNLLHSFDWKLPNCMSPSDVDMKEKYVTSMAKVEPLLAIPSDRRRA